MKTKAPCFILIAVIALLLCINKAYAQQQQYFITYSLQDQINCDTICDTLSIGGSLVDLQMIEFVDWDVSGTNNYQFVDQFSIYGCFYNNFVTATIFLNDGSVVEVTEFIFVSEPPMVFEIINDAAQFCPAANNGQSNPGTNNCDAVVCKGTTVTYFWELSGNIFDIFINNSTGGTGPFEVVIDPSLGLMEVTWEEPGIYSLSIIFVGECGSAIRTICTEVLEDPIASFNSTPSSSGDTIFVCQGQSLQLENTSQYATSYQWNLGDGNITDVVDPTVSYSNPGTYQIELTAYNDCLCSNSTQKTVVVEEAVIPIVDCIGTICENSIATYEAAAICNEYQWQVSSNGTIIGGGGPTDNYISVSWGEGPEGLVELLLMDCNGANTCMEPAQLIVPILSEQGNITGDANVCRGAITSYQITPYEGTSFDWSVSPFGSIIDGQGTDEITVEWFGGNIPGNPEHWVAVSYDNCYLGCGGQDTLEILINPEFYTISPLESCVEDSTQHRALSFPFNNPVVSNWEVYNQQDSLVWQSSTAASEVMIPWMGAAGTYTILTYPEDTAAFCLPVYRSAINILPLPLMDNTITGDTLICPGQAYTYEATANDPRASIFWEITDGSTAAMLEGSSINYTFGTTPPYIVSAYAVDPFGCSSASVSRTLTSIPAPTIQADLDGCVESMTSFSATAFDDLSYSWEIIPADHGTITGPKDGSDIQVLWHSAGKVEVAVTLCGQSDTVELMIHPLPAPIVTHPDAVCPGQQALVQGQSGFMSYSWFDENDNPVGNGQNNLLFPGTYRLEVTDDFGCAGSTVFQLESFPQPSVNISTPDPNVFCNTTISTRLFANITGAGYDYQWYNGAGLVGTNSPTFTATVAGIYRVEITDNNGCIATSNPIVVLEDCGSGPPLPGPSCPTADGFDIFPTAECDTRQYQSQTPGAITWEWIFDDPASGANNTSTLENPTHEYTSVGFYRVFQLVGYPVMGNPDTLFYCPTIRVDTVLVKADFKADTVCAGSPTTFEDLSTFMSFTSISSWQWDFGDPASGADNTSTLENPTHVYNNPGFYTVSLTISAPTGCTSTQTRTVEVKSLPDINFLLPADNCEDIALPFFAQAGSDVVEILWNFGDPASGDANLATEQSTFHDYLTPGDYDISLQAESLYGCSNSITQQITISPNTLSGNITAAPGVIICEGDSTTLSASPGGSSWLWSTGANSESITVHQTDVYSVTVVDDMGCVYTPPSLSITVLPPPETIIRLIEYNEFQQPIHYYYDNYEACEGTDVTLQVIEEPGYSYQWSNGENGTMIEFLEDRDNQLTSGTYTFDVTVTNNATGCSNVSTPFEVIIHPLPAQPFISSTPSGLNCEGSMTTFEVTNIMPGITYIWSNGVEGSTMQTDIAGTYFVSATSPEGCATRSTALNIVGGPDISLVPNGCYSRCRPDTLCLPDIPGIVSYQWLLDGSPIGSTSSTPPELIATNSGSYQLEMINNFGCILTSDPLDLELFDGIGSLIGQVWVDVNDNGLIDGGDTLYAGAQIELLLNNNLQNSTLSNPEGSYAFPNIEANTYTLILDSLSLPANLSPLYTQVDTSFSGCGVEVPVDWLLIDLCQPDTSMATLSNCDSVVYNGLSYTRDTAFTSTFNSIIGCDSVVLVDIQVFESPDTTFISDTGCQGDTLLVDGTAIPFGDTVHISYTSLSGCDSIVSVQTNILPASDSTLMLQACPGTTITYEGTPLSPGQQMDFNFTNAQGCDSTVTVLVETLLQTDSTLMLQACEGATVTYEGTELSPGQQMDFSFTNAQGCDSTVTVLVETLLQSDSTLMLQACEGATITYEGTELSPGQQMDFSFANAQGCDSTVTVLVETLLQTDSTLMLQACEGTTITYQGTELNPGQQMDFSFTNAQGCDSTVTVLVETLLQSDSMLMLQACEGATITYAGTELSPGQQMDFSFANAQGCDSTVTVLVEALLQSDSTLMLQACEGTTITYQGTELNPGQQMDFSFTNAQGCDSTVTVLVETLSASDTILFFEACQGTTITYDGSDITAGEQAAFTYTNFQGCDSTVTVMVNELLSTDSILQLSACTGSSIEYNGISIPAGGQEVFMLTNEAGCDSILTVTVEEVGVLTAQVQLSACEGDSTSYNGQLLPAGSSQEFTFTASSGCDSVVTVEVLPISNDTTFLTLSACPGETANYNGNELAAGSQQQFVFLNEQGCDSIVSVTVESATAINIELSDEHSCPNIASGIVNIELLPGSASPLSFALNGAPYSSDLTYTGLAAGAYTLIAQDTNGCQLSSNFNIESEPPLIIDIESQPITCDQAQGVLLANVRSGDDGSLTLTWSDSTTGNLLTSTQAGTFQLEATNACEAQTYEFTLLDVRPDEASLLYVPNAFSPNDDGVNDTFRAYTGRSSIWNQYHLMVFDRWGNMLFETNDPEVGWDGFFRGTLMNDAVHVWHIEGEIENCGRTFQITNKGDVTIVR